MRILLVEDNTDLTDKIVDTFEENSIYVWRVNSATEALEEFKFRPNDWDAIIVDFPTDGDIGASNFAKQIYEIYPNFPIILHTQHVYDNLSPAIQELFNFYVAKDEQYSPTQLLMTIKSIEANCLKTIKVEQSPYDVARINKLHADALQVFWAIGKENKKDLALKWVEEHYLFMFSQLFKGCTVTQTLSDCKLVDVQPNEK